MNYPSGEWSPWCKSILKNICLSREVLIGGIWGGHKWGNLGGHQGARLHDLRCTFGSIQAELGANMAVTKSLMGHRSMQTTQKYYTAISLEPARDSASRHNDFMLQIAGSNA